MLRWALKEWAVVCRALAEGRQSLLLRKGGVAEETGRFEPAHRRFWLFPTYAHQQREGVRPEALPLLDEAARDRPAAGTLQLSHWAEVTGIYHVRSLVAAQVLAHLHVWSDEAVAKRFEYREPGLFVLSVRVYRSGEPCELPDLPEYEGCRSWVDLGRELPTAGSVPVRGDAAARDAENQIDLLLNPSSLA